MGNESLTLEELAEPILDSALPFLDKQELIASPPSGLSEDQQFWMREGYLVKRNFLPHRLIDAYTKVWQDKQPWWTMGVCFVFCSEMRDILCYRPLTEKLKELVGAEMALSLSLCGWKSTERNWHQDAHLYGPNVGGFSIAVWIALDEIHPDSGPFQFVPGSHRWPIASHRRISKALTPEERRHPVEWPKHAERIFTPIFESRIQETRSEVKEFAPASKGDLLIWHTFLTHRGSTPKDRGRLRKSLIAHYAAVNRVASFPQAIQHKDQGWYYPSSLAASSAGKKGSAKKIPASLLEELWSQLR